MKPLIWDLGQATIPVSLVSVYRILPHRLSRLTTLCIVPHQYLLVCPSPSGPLDGLERAGRRMHTDHRRVCT